MSYDIYTPIEIFQNGVLFDCGCKIVNGKEYISLKCRRTSLHPVSAGWLTETADRTYNRFANDFKNQAAPTALLY